MSMSQGGLADLLIGLPQSGYVPPYLFPDTGEAPDTGIFDLLHELIALPVSEWIVAMVCAVIAAFAYELTIKALKETKQVTLMLPVLLLRLTRLTTSREKFHLLHERQWYPDLHDLLTDTHHTAIARYLKGLQFSLALVLGGAIRAARQTQAPARPARRRSERTSRLMVMASSIFAMAFTIFTVVKAASGDTAYILGGLGVVLSFCGLGIAVVIWLRDPERSQRRKQQP